MADQPLNPNYVYGAVTAGLAGKTAAQKHALKASTLNGLAQARLPYTFVLRGVTVTVTEASIVGANLLRFVVGATRGGLPLTVDNPLLFVNPPLLAPNGATFTDASGVHPVMSEQPLVALQEIVTQTVERQNR